MDYQVPANSGIVNRSYNTLAFTLYFVGVKSPEEKHCIGTLMQMMSV